MAWEPPVRVAEVAGRGRALVAARHIKPGEVILVDSPILLYPNSSSTAHLFCFHCFRSLSRSSSPPLPCPSCPGAALFCSPRCLALAAASSHSPALCLALSRLPPDLPADLRSPAVFLLHAYNLPADNFHRLLSLAASPSPADEEHRTAAALHSLVASLLPPAAAAAVSPATTAALLARDKANAFGLMEPFREDDPAARAVRAYGIYPRAALFNHDCLPNACRFDYVDGDAERNTDITIRALHDIPEGREICLSYFPVNWSYRERQRRLAEDYGFLCECDRCRVEKTWTDDDDDDDDRSEENMEEEGDDETMEASMEEEEEHNANGAEDGDFPHAYFFVTYLCDRDNCGGTLAPLPPSPQGTPSHVMECNVCGRLRTEQDIGEGGGKEDGDGAMLDA